MIQLGDLVELGKIIVEGRARGDVRGFGELGEMMAAHPGTVLTILDLIAKETGRKKPDDALVEAYGFMLGRTLEVFRFGVERNHGVATACVSAVRQRVRKLVEEKRLGAGSTLLILRQFVFAKLDLGEELQELLSELGDRMPVDKAAPMDVGAAFAEMIEACGGDVFAFQSELAQHAATSADDRRAGIVAALLAAGDAVMREAAIGWLLDPGAGTRRDSASLLLQAANAGQVSPTMLRRLIVMRNWLPESERSGTDDIIQASRRRGVECAPVPSVDIRDVVATALDGSGAQSFFILAKDGRRLAVNSLLVKLGAGVRDAWVLKDLTKRDADAFFYRVVTEADCYDSNLDHVRQVLAHSLFVSQQTGELPPFGLVDVVERIGLADLQPEAMPVDDLVAGLIEGIPGRLKSAASIAEALRELALWHDGYPFLETWFEDDGALDALLGGKRLSKKRRIELALDDCLSGRRRWWAEILGWTAAMLRHDQASENDWMSFALVAGELLGKRPISEIPLMLVVAASTVEAWLGRR